MINRIKKQNAKPLANIKYERKEVQSGLSVTPAEMMSLSERGIPISSHVDESLFYDGDTKPIGDMDPMQMRGIDMVDAWNMQQSSRKRLVDANKKDFNTYG